MSHQSQQLVSDLKSAPSHGEAIENNEVVKQLLEHIITLKLVSQLLVSKPTKPVCSDVGANNNNVRHCTMY